jgi:hypothetical protein
MLIGHCLSRFDGQLILESLIEQNITISKIQSRGMKLMGMTVGPHNVKFSDSFLLFPTSLSKFSRAMSVGAEKGFCPILANSCTALDKPPGRCPPRRHFIVPKDRQEEFEVFLQKTAN